MQIDEGGQPTPVSLEEFMTGVMPKPKPKAVTFSVEPEIEVMEVSEGEDCDSDRTDDGHHCAQSHTDLGALGAYHYG